VSVLWKKDRQECRKRQAGMPVLLPPDTTTPHEVDCMARWGENPGKLQVLIIVGSGAYVHLCTVESHCVWTLRSPVTLVFGSGEYSLPDSLFQVSSVYADARSVSRFSLTAAETYKENSSDLRLI